MSFGPRKARVDSLPSIQTCSKTQATHSCLACRKRPPAHKAVPASGSTRGIVATRERVRPYSDTSVLSPSSAAQACIAYACVVALHAAARAASRSSGGERRKATANAPASGTPCRQPCRRWSLPRSVHFMGTSGCWPRKRLALCHPFGPRLMTSHSACRVRASSGGKQVEAPHAADVPRSLAGTGLVHLVRTRPQRRTARVAFQANSASAGGVS